MLLTASGEVEDRPTRALRRVRPIGASTLAEATEALLARRPVEQPTSPPPTPRERLPVWTEEDLAADPQFQTVLDGCAVLRRLAERAVVGDALAHDELVAVEYTLGHLDHGPEGVNLMLSRVPGVAPKRRMRHRHSGHPTSCSKLRKRLVGIASRVGCSCDFGPRLPTYPNPLLHLEGGSGGADLQDEEG